MAAKKKSVEKKSESVKTSSKKATKTVSTPVKNKKVSTSNNVTNMSIDPKVEAKTQEVSVKKMSLKTKIAIVAGFSAVVALLYINRGLLVAATVNGEPISRIEVVSEIEKRFGRQALDSIITEKLVLQELRSKNMSVSETEIQDEIKKIEERVKASGQDLATLLTFQGMSMEDLRKQIVVAKAAEKILADKVTVSDQEIADYIKSNASSLPEGMSEEDQKAEVKDQLTQQKLSTEFNTMVEELRAKAKINELVTY